MPSGTITPITGAGARRVTPPRPAPARALPRRPADAGVFPVAGPMETAARGAPRGGGGAERLLGELEARVQDVVRASSWWERHGLDCSVLALSLLALPPGEGHGTRDTGRGDKGPGWGEGARKGRKRAGGGGVGETLRAGDPKSDRLFGVSCPVSSEDLGAGGERGQA